MCCSGAGPTSGPALADPLLWATLKELHRSCTDLHPRPEQGLLEYGGVDVGLRHAGFVAARITKEIEDMKPQRNTMTLLLAAAMLAGGVAACTSTPTTESMGEYVDDAAVTAHVKTALAKAEGVNWTAIDVETYRGVVSLSGFVDSNDMASRAVAAAEEVRGVKSVKNDMQVKPAS
jgi:hyperosmotically inducible periplasmic protein